MIRVVTGLHWKGALLGLLALASVSVGSVKALLAHFTPNYEQVVAAAGPIVPGSFQIVGEEDTGAGHLVIYTVERPGHASHGLGAILTYQPGLLSRSTTNVGESDYVPTGTVEFGVVPMGNRNLVYGVTTPGVGVIKATTVDGGSQFVSVDPRGGFFLTVPRTDAGAAFSPVGDSSP